MSNKGVAPPDYMTSVGQFRALIGDTDWVPLVPDEPGFGDYAFYSDDAINGLLAVYPNVKRAAAQALRTIAATQALLLKKWSTDDLSVDGAAIAEALRKLAAGLDEQADNEDSNIDIFELVPLATQCDFFPELSPFVVGKRYGIAEIDDC